MRSLVIGLLLICGSAQAQVVAVDVSGLQGTYLLTVQGGNVTVSPITLVRPSPGPGPIVPIPPSPSLGLTETVKAATAAVPSHPNKDANRRIMAFGMSFLAQATANTPVDKSRETVRQFCDASVGADKSHWVGWWATLDAKLNSMALTPASYTAALGEIANGLTADLPPADSEPFGRTPTYGLSPELIKILLEVLLPLLIKLLSGT